MKVRLQAHVRVDLVEVLEAQPLTGEARSERVDLRVGEHAQDLCLEHAIVQERSVRGHPPQLGVRGRGPEEVRQTRRQRERVDEIRLSCSDVSGGPLEPEDESRAR